MIDWFATLRICQGVTVLFRRWKEIGGIRFHENSIRGQFPKEGSLCLFALMQEIRRKGKMRAPFQQERCERRRPRPRMQKKTPLRTGVFLQYLTKRFVSFDAMNRDDHIPFPGYFQLPDEDPLLILDVVSFDPAVEPCFADAGFGMPVQEIRERFLPFTGALFDIPWVEAKCGAQPPVRGAELLHGGPVRFRCAVHNAACNSQRGQFLEDRFTERSQPGIMQVLMRIVIHNTQKY